MLRNFHPSTPRLLILLILSILLMAPWLVGQTTPILSPGNQTTVDMSGAQSTKPIKSGTTIPSTCTVGELFFKSDAPAGSNISMCTATDTWSQLGIANYSQGFAAQTSVALAHNKSTTAIVVACYDNSAQPLQIGYNSLQITNSNTATVTFASPQTGTCVVNTSGGGTGVGGSGGLADPGANGFVARTALDTTAPRTFQGTTNRLTITNPTGLAGDPVFDLGSQAVTTAQNATFGAFTYDFSGATAIRIKTGAGAPSSTLCDQDTELGSLYLQNDTNSLFSPLYACARTSTTPTRGWILLTTVVSGTTAPTNCTVGQLFFKTDATAGQNLFGCTATDTWTQLGGAGGGGDVTQSGTNTFTGTNIFTSSIRRIPNGTSLPGTCTVGDEFMDTDATLGQQHFLCTSTNTWTLQGDGGGGGVSDGDKEDITVSSSGTNWQINAGAVGNTEVASGIDAVKIGAGGVTNTEFGYLANVTSDIQGQIDALSSGGATQISGLADCKVSVAGDTLTVNTPCTLTFGSVTTSVASTATCVLSGTSSSGTMYVYAHPDLGLVCDENTSATNTPTNATAQTTGNFPSGVVPIATATFTSNSFTAANERRSFVNASIPVAGTGIGVTEIANGTKQIAVDATVAIIPTLQSGAYNYVRSTTGNDTYTGTLAQTLTTYTRGMCVVLDADTANTGTATLAIDGLSAISILTHDGNSLASGDIGANEPKTICFDGTNFLIQGDGGGGGGGISNVVEDTTPQLGGNLDLNSFTVGAATAADLTKLNAITASATELNYSDNVTSDIQTQLNARGLKAGDTWTGTHDFSGATVVRPIRVASGAPSSTACDQGIELGSMYMTNSIPSYAGNTYACSVLESGSVYGWIRQRTWSVGTTPPTTCSDGDIHFDTDATSGQRVLGCEGGSWVAQGDGTGSGSFGETSLAGLANNQTLWDGSQATRTLTAGLSGSTDPVITFGDNLINVSTGAFQVGGSAVLVSGGALGTPSSGTLTNATGLPVSTGISGLGTGVATFLATPSGANLASALTTALPPSKGGTGLTSGTSGGILAFTASGTLASSGALTANLPVIGGGAGVAPTVGTRSGNTTAFVTTTGTQTSGRCVEIDANGNHIASAAGCSGSVAGSDTQVIFNDGGSAYGGDAGLTYNKTTDVLTVAGGIAAGGGGAAGGLALLEGTACTPGTNEICIYAPSDVTTAYGIVLPAASATGFLLGTNSSNVNTISFVGSTGSGNVVLATSASLTTPNLGTPSAATLTNATGLPISTGVSGLGTGVATFLGTPSSANLASAVTGETGSGALVFATSPALTTPDLGTPSAATLTNATGLPISTGVSGLGTGVATFLGSPSSTNLAAAVTGETGSGQLVFGTSPTITTPTFSGSATWGDNARQTFNPGANAAGLNVGCQANAPDTPSNGDFYCDSDDGKVYARISGAWVDLSAAGGTGITSLGGLTAGTQTITRGTGIGGSSATADHSFTFDATELAALTWGDGSQASIAWTWNLSAGDPVLTAGNGVLNVSTGALQEGGVNVSLPARSETLTNKAIDAEGTGNTLTISSKIPMPLVACAGTTGTVIWDTLATLGPTATCSAGSTETNMIRGVADFPDSDGDYSVQQAFLLPDDWTGNIDAKFLWRAAATTGNVVWQIQTACRANAEVDDVTWNTASTVTDAALGTANQLNSATISAVTTTGCAAGELLHVRVLRNRTHASDTITGVVSLGHVELTTRRAI